MIPYRLISIYFLIHSYIYMCIYLFTQGQIQKFWFQGRSHYFWFQRGGGGRPTLKIRYLYLLKIAKFSGEKGVCVCVCVSDPWNPSRYATVTYSVISFIFCSPIPFIFLFIYPFIFTYITIFLCIRLLIGIFSYSSIFFFSM